jgi:hypothetical protein
MHDNNAIEYAARRMDPCEATTVHGRLGFQAGERESIERIGESRDGVRHLSIFFRRAKCDVESRKH